MLEFLESTGVTETPGVTQLVTFGWFGTEAVYMFWLNGLPRRGSPEALCFTELVMLCSGTVGSPKRGSTEAACVTDLAMRQNIRTEVN